MIKWLQTGGQMKRTTIHKRDYDIPIPCLNFCCFCKKRKKDVLMFNSCTCVYISKIIKKVPLGRKKL